METFYYTVSRNVESNTYDEELCLTGTKAISIYRIKNNVPLEIVTLDEVDCTEASRQVVLKYLAENIRQAVYDVVEL